MILRSLVVSLTKLWKVLRKGFFMATEYKDVIRVTDTEANLLSNLKNGMIGFATDTNSICFKYSGTLYKIKSVDGLTNTYIPYVNSGVLDDSVVVNTIYGITVEGTLAVDTVSHGVVDSDEFLVNGATLSYRTAAELLTDLSGDAGATFDWNTQDLTGIANLTASAKIECADLDITSISDYNVPYNFVNAMSDSPMWIDSGKVGVGTTACLGLLHVWTADSGTVAANAWGDEGVFESDGHTGISILAPDASDCRVIFGNASDNLGAQVWWDYTDDEFTIGTSKVGADVVIDTSGGTECARFTSAGNVTIPSDSGTLQVGAGNDMSVGYDGTDGLINTSLVAASDLNITCGANKTIELQNSVYDDMQFAIDTGVVPGANNPTWEALTTNVYAYSFDVDDYIDVQCNEPPHKWAESTDGELHLHLSPKTGNSTGSDRFAQFTIYIAAVNSDGSDTWSETNQTAELTIPNGTSALTGFYLTFGTNLDLSSYNLATQIKIRVKRIAATGGTEFADNVFVTQCGCHLQQNTLGSRTASTK